MPARPRPACSSLASDARLRSGFLCGSDDVGECAIEILIDVGRATQRLCQQVAARIANAGAAFRSATINAEKI